MHKRKIQYCETSKLFKVITNSTKFKFQRTLSQYKQKKLQYAFSMGTFSSGIVSKLTAG